MPRLSYRGRLFLALLTVSAIPVALMTAAGVVALRAVDTDIRGREAVDQVQRTTVEVLNSLQGTQLAPAAEAAMTRQSAAINQLITLTDQTAGLARRFPLGLAVLVVVAAVVLLFMVAVVGRSLAGQLAAPLHEVVEWTGRIKRREPLPATGGAAESGIPEFAELRAALRDLAESLEQGRRAELEAERLRAFGEVARRVAHEMKNPLTPIRLAVLQLKRGVPPEQAEMLDIIAAESARLEAMSREFAQLGRLPDGIASSIDLHELLEGMLRAAIPDGVTTSLAAEPGSYEVVGHYDPIRRAFSNLLRNAVEACGGVGTLAVTMTRRGGVLEVAIADSGPGVPPEKREMIFEPYFTDKRDGTGLGLAIVRQTIEQHGGTIHVTDTPGGGATFLVRLPQ
ncbi:MAG TPA: HAMP domain-containing sensor histidine kinase [Gemmatimonadales bacterium]|nr:HAMP domain-containing sensor histidine kinase [Gemmatimonadales bacterium]